MVFADAMAMAMRGQLLKTGDGDTAVIIQLAFQVLHQRLFILQFPAIPDKRLFGNSGGFGRPPNMVGDTESGHARIRNANLR